MERLFEPLRQKLSNRVFEAVEELEAAISEELKVFWEEPKLLVSLTGYPWWVQAAQNIQPLAS